MYIDENNLKLHVQLNLFKKQCKIETIHTFLTRKTEPKTEDRNLAWDDPLQVSTLPSHATHTHTQNKFEVALGAIKSVKSSHNSSWHDSSVWRKMHTLTIYFSEKAVFRCSQAFGKHFER